MRRELAFIHERDLCFSIAGQLYSQAPNRMPRKANIIMEKVVKAFRESENCVNSNEMYTVFIEKENEYKWIENLLYSIPEFKELNLTQIEYENHVDVDDPSRGKFKFTSAYDVETSESWKNDFVDLDAFISNVVRNLVILHESDEDCFGCIYERKRKDDKDHSCTTCVINPAYKNNYKCHRTPRGNRKLSCKFDCYRNFYICCKECERKKECKHVCTSDPETCNQELVKAKSPLIVPEWSDTL